MTPGRIQSGKSMRFRVFNPHRLSADELRETFVARQKLFDAIMRDIKGHTDHSMPQHQLIVGQRGMGKTTLLQRIAVELHSKPLCETFLPLTFPEEQYVEVDRLSKFWLNCMDSAADALERENNLMAVQKVDAIVRQLEQLQTDEVTFSEQCHDAFRSVWKELKRRPVLLIDNFNLLLSRLRGKDYNLRGYFTKRGGPILIAASTIYPEQTEDYGAAFYEGFKTHVLNPLTLAEISDVFRHLARVIQRPQLEARIHQEMPRLAALRDLTGGNPRTAVLLFELFVDGFSEDAYEDLDALLDIVTPLYQSRLEQLSEQAQTIVGTLARHWAPLTKTGIVESARLNSSSVPAQLGRLREIGLVEETPIFPGKKVGYQIAERFFNIWYLMRFTTRRQRASLSSLARFLEEYHTPAERLRSAGVLLKRENFSRGNINYAMTLAQSMAGLPQAVELERRAQLELIRQMSGVRAKIAELLDPDEIEPRVYEFAELREKLASAVPSAGSVTTDEFVDLVLSSPSMVPGGKAKNTLANRNALAASKLSDEDARQVFSRLQTEQQELKKAFGKDAVDWLGDRLRNNAVVSWDDCNDVTFLIETASTKAQASLLRKCVATAAIARLTESTFGKFADLLQLRPKKESSAIDWLRWGVELHTEFGRYEEAAAAYREAIRIDPEFACPWNNLGYLLQNHQGRYEEAEAAYREAIRIDPEDTYPWCNLGILLMDHQGRYEEAEAACREAIRIDGEYANCWNALGNLLSDYLDRVDEASECYHRAIDYDQTSDSPRHNLVFLFRDRLEKSAEARQLFEEVRDPSTFPDTQHLQRALFAAYDDNWGMAADELRLALAETDGRLPPVTRDDWFRASAVLLHLGFGERLVALLTDAAADVNLLPWFAAVDAHHHGDRRHLGNIPLEARPSAEQIYDEIEFRRSQLPQKSRRK